MKLYRINYQNFDNVLTKIVRAPSAQVAVASMSLSSHQVITVVRHYSLFLRQTVDLDNQSLVLLSLYSAVLSGQNLKKTLIRTLSDLYPNRKSWINKIEEADILSVSELLQALMFDPIVISIIASSEVSGTLDRGLLEADKFLTLKKKDANTIKTSVLGGLMNFFAGIGSILLFPVLIAEAINSGLMGEQGNLLTQLILFINDYFINILIVLTSLIGLIYYLKSYHWDYIKHIYPFSLFNRLFELQNAVVFLSIYQTMSASGAKVRKIVEAYALSGDKAGQKLLTLINKSKSLADAIALAGFPSVFTTPAVSVFNYSEETAKHHAIEKLFDVLEAYSNKQARKIARLFKSAAFCLIIFAMVMIVVGFYAPMVMQGVASMSLGRGF